MYFKETGGKMKYLITGGSGFIGTNLILKLLELGHEVTTIDKEDLNDAVRGGVIHLFADVSKDDLTPWYEKQDVVIHLAAQSGVVPSIEDPEYNFHNNVLGTFNCLESTRKAGVTRFVFASSGGTVVGDCDPPLHEELVPKPRTPYGCSKLCGEAYCMAYSATYGIDAVALRFSNVYGPHSLAKTHNLIPSFIMNAIEDKVCTIYGDGSFKKDYIYVEDLIQGIILASISEGVAGEVIQIATGAGNDVKTIFDIIETLAANICKRKLKVEYGESRSGDINYDYCDISKAERILKYSPKHNVYDGIVKTFEWYTKNYGGNKNG